MKEYWARQLRQVKRNLRKHMSSLIEWTWRLRSGTLNISSGRNYGTGLERGRSMLVRLIFFLSIFCSGQGKSLLTRKSAEVDAGGSYEVEDSKEEKHDPTGGRGVGGAISQQLNDEIEAKYREKWTAEELSRIGEQEQRVS
jgi:hypothetical protein